MGPLEQGSVVGSYRVERVLGQGGMGVVYEALDRRLDRRVALKLLSSKTAQDVQFRERFLRESRIAASIDHPNVLPVYEAGEVGGQLYIAMRVVEGEDLGALLRRDGALEPARGVALIAQVADALDAVHQRGLVHRDIKPGNILIHTAGAREHPYVADFGITKVLGEGTALTNTGAFVGTIDYCAPEVIRGDALDGRADVYALGCVLFECLTGEKPYPRNSDLAVIYAHLEDAPPAASDRRPELPAALDAVVARAMAKEADDRFATAGELADAALAALAATPAATATTAERERPRLGGRARAAGAALLALCVAGAAVAAVMSGGGGEGDDDDETSASDDSDVLAARVPAREGRSIIGSDLSLTPGEAGYCSGDGDSACTVVQLTLGGTDQAARADGVITRWSVRGGKGPLALRVVVGKPGQQRTVAGGPTVRATGRGVEAFSVRIPIDTGQRIGVEQGLAGFLPFRYRDEETTAVFYDPPLSTTPAASYTEGPNLPDYEYLYNATIEPDDDRDGRGDLTQDPDHGGVGASCPRSDVLARGAGSSVIRRGKRLFGCRGGVQTRIGTPGAGVRFERFEFRGDQLALVRIAGGRSSILIFDLGDRHRTFATSQTAADDRPRDWTVRDLVVARSGSAAWLASPRGAPDRAALWVRGPRGVKAVDSGSLKPGSLQVNAAGDGVKYTDLEGRSRDTGF